MLARRYDGYGETYGKTPPPYDQVWSSHWLYVQPSPTYYMSADAERIQMALLGIEPEYSERRVLGFVAYIIFLMALVTIMFALEL